MYVMTVSWSAFICWNCVYCGVGRKYAGWKRDMHGKVTRIQPCITRFIHLPNKQRDTHHITSHTLKFVCAPPPHPTAPMRLSPPYASQSVMVKMSRSTPMVKPVVVVGACYYSGWGDMIDCGGIHTYLHYMRSYTHTYDTSIYIHSYIHTTWSGMTDDMCIYIHTYDTACARYEYVKI